MGNYNSANASKLYFGSDIEKSNKLLKEIKKLRNDLLNYSFIHIKNKRVLNFTPKELLEKYSGKFFQDLCNEVILSLNALLQYLEIFTKDVRIANKLSKKLIYLKNKSIKENQEHVTYVISNLLKNEGKILYQLKHDEIEMAERIDDYKIYWERKLKHGKLPSGLFSSFKKYNNVKLKEVFMNIFKGEKVESENIYLFFSKFLEYEKELSTV